MRIQMTIAGYPRRRQKRLQAESDELTVGLDSLVAVRASRCAAPERVIRAIRTVRFCAAEGSIGFVEPVEETLGVAILFGGQLPWWS